MAQLKLTQVRSSIKRPHTQVSVLKTVGLGRIGKTVIVEDSPSIQGVIAKIGHLLKVEKI
ncbi:MAG: 50S ribosomal protein L30 [Sphingobacteriales bacterium]|nr:50S ribosomal protein L30 [Sphingobacteriales bacterium]